MPVKYPYYLQHERITPERVKERRYSRGGVHIERRHRHGSASTVKGLSYDVQRRQLHKHATPRKHRIHEHHVGTGHHKVHPLTSAGHRSLDKKPRRLHHSTHRSVGTTSAASATSTTTTKTAAKTSSARTTTSTAARRSATGLTGYAAFWAKATPAERHAIAEKRIATMKARGEKIGFARLTAAQRSVYAKKAAATRKAEGIKPFGHESAATRKAAALKAAATRRARGIKPFAKESAASRHAAALKASRTRAAKHER